MITQVGILKYCRVHGYSDLENQTPLSINDNFRIQSNSKQITAVLVLKEVENGKIDLSKPIRGYLPGFKRNWADTVTVHHLLSMASGVVGFDEPLIYQPGTDYNYSNPGYGLLGRIIESVIDYSYIELA